MQVLTVTPESARLDGPASAMQKLGEIAIASKVMDTFTLLLLSDVSTQSCFVSLSAPQQISYEDADKLSSEMPVFLMGEGVRPLRSENVSAQFPDLCGVVDNGRLILTSRAPAQPGMRLS